MSKITEKIDELVEVSCDEWYADKPEDERDTVKADLYNRIEGTIFQWTEDCDAE